MVFDVMKYFGDKRYSMREIRVKIAEEAIRMETDERKQCVDECNRMIAKANAEGDAICLSQGDLQPYEYPDEIDAALVDIGHKIGYLNGIRCSLAFPQLYL